MRFAATVARGLAPGDEIVCTRLDHDSNVRPWVIAAERAGATVRFAGPEPERWSCRPRGRGGTERAHALGGGDRRLQRGRDGAGPAGDRRGGPAGRRARLRGRRARDAAPPPRPRRAPRRRHRLQRVQVVRAARRARAPARRSSRSTGRTRSSRRPRSRRTAGSWARCPSRRWPASAPPPSTCWSSTSTPSRPTSNRCCDALEGLGAMDHVTLYGNAADRAPTLCSPSPAIVHRRRDAPRRARDRGLGRQLLRLGARARARPRSPRRHARRLPALQRCGRRRAPPRGGRVTGSAVKQPGSLGWRSVRRGRRSDRQWRPRRGCARCWPRTPELLSARLENGREDYFARPYLLWFVAENPIRHGALPANIVGAHAGAARAPAPRAATTRSGWSCSGPRTARARACNSGLIDALVDAGADPNCLDPALAHRENDAARAVAGARRAGSRSSPPPASSASSTRPPQPPRSARSRFAGAAASRPRGRASRPDRRGRRGSTPSTRENYHSHSTALHSAVDSGYGRGGRGSCSRRRRRPARSRTRSSTAPRTTGSST